MGGRGGGSNPLFEPFMDSLRIAVPLVTQQRQIDAYKQRADQVYLQHKEELLQKAQQASKEVEVKTLMEAYKGASEGMVIGDPAAEMRVRATASALEAAVGKPFFPRDEVGEIVAAPWAKPAQPKETTERISPLGQLMKERDMLPPGDPRRKQYDDVIAKSGQAPGTTVNVNNIPLGNQPLEKAPKSDLQREVAAIHVQRATLKNIGEQFKKDYLKYGSKIKQAWLNFSEKAGKDLSPEDANFVKNMQNFTGTVKRLFNLYRKEITGAAAAMAELKDLQEALINMEMGPTQFEGALASYEKELARSLRIKNKLLRKGIDVSDDKNADAFDNEFFSGGDDDIVERGNELKNKYPQKSDAEIGKMLLTEGYNPQ